MKNFLDEDFVLKAVNLSWFEIIWAIKRGFLTKFFLKKFAEKKISEGYSSSTLVKILGIPDAYIENALVEAEVIASGEILLEENFVELKWATLMLKYLYINVDDFENPFQIVEELYEELNYPEYIRPFVAYLPPSDYNPRMHSKKSNRNRLMSKWKQFLDAHEHLLAG